MRILLESCDGCGKDELAKRLCKHYKLDEIHLLNSRDREFPQKYFEKHHLTNIVMNRSFVSEYIYSKYYKRQSYVDKNIFETLLSVYRDIEKWKIIFLCAEPEILFQRINKRGEDKEELEKLKEIDSMYRAIAISYKIPLIDTSKLTIEEVFQKALEIL